MKRNPATTGLGTALLLALILAAVNLIEIPIGTAHGIHAFWVLLKEESTQLLNAVPARFVQTRAAWPQLVVPVTLPTPPHALWR